MIWTIRQVNNNFTLCFLILNFQVDFIKYIPAFYFFYIDIISLILNVLKCDTL